MTPQTVELIKNKFLECNCDLLDTDFENKNRDSELKFICSCGREGYGSWNVFRRKGTKVRCKRCMGFFTQKEAEEIFTSNGCQLLDVYKNVTTKMKYVCKCGNTYSSSLSAFNRGHTQCKECSNKQIGNNHRHSYQYVYDYFEKNGFELLSKTYEFNDDPLDYICICKRKARGTFTHIQQGGKCIQCRSDNLRELCSKEKSSNWISDRDYVETRAAIADRARSMVYNLFKNLNKTKNDRTHKLLGYSINELYGHITSHPNWNNVKSEKWDLDHIFPISAFVEHGITDFKMINALDNLQPLSMSENRKKYKFYDIEKFHNYLKDKYGMTAIKKVNCRSSKVQVAPQESELESYLVGAANTTLTEDDFDGMSL